MIDFLSNPIFQGIGAIFGFFGVIVAVIAIFAVRKRKKLEYEIVDTTELLDVNSQVINELKVYFNGVQVESFYLVLIKIINSGNIPIDKTDFVTPIQFSFGENAVILNTEVIQDENNLNPEVLSGVNNSQITPLVINQGDTFVIKYLISQFEKVSLSKGRIVGVKSINQFSRKSRKIARLIISLILLFLAVFLLLTSYILISFILIGITYVLAYYEEIVSFLHNPWKRNQKKSVGKTK